MVNWRETLRRAGLGRAAFHLWHRPVGRIRDSLRNGGPLAERETERRRAEMEAAAATLGPLPTFAGVTPVKVHLMTGRRFWYQTAFCLHSLARTSRVPLVTELYDDGSIDDACAVLLRSLGAGIHIHRRADLIEQLERHLPTSRFPTLRDRWERYPNIRKLIDVHLASSGWKLVLDSDLLFFHRADALLHWAGAPNALLHAIDCEESYGYSRALLERIAGAPLPSKLNVGVCGLRSDALDWEQLEDWTRELQARENTSYYLEQALVAMLAARQPATALPAVDYVTMPQPPEAHECRAVMHHYVATSKRWYFRHNWRRALPQ